MCGIIGISNHKEAAELAFMGLYALQHRGEEAAGIISFDGKHVHSIKEPGLVADHINEQALSRLKGNIAIGHTRYSTTGSSNVKNIQPFLVTHRRRPMAVAHNGNLTNTAELHRFLEEQGSLFQSTMDSELIVHLLAKSKHTNIKALLKEALSQLQGAFSLVFLIGDTLVGTRDPNGFRPLCLGNINGAKILASETCALDLMGARFVREIEPGEIVLIRGKNIESLFFAKDRKKSQCIFENIYFARPDSFIFNDTVYAVRKRLGAQLAKEHPVKKADFVMAIPDSGNYAALGYSQQSGLPFEIGMIRNHYIGRTFIQPSQFLRDFRVKVKLNPISTSLKGKRIVVVEDSIVRGTTSRSRIDVLRQAGAKEIHLRISCPPIRFPCFYGIDFPSKQELIASRKSVKAIADFIKVDSLEYLSQAGMIKVMKSESDFCHACFSGEYPVKIPKRKTKYVLERK